MRLYEVLECLHSKDIVTLAHRNHAVIKTGKVELMLCDEGIDLSQIVYALRAVSTDQIKITVESEG